MKKKIKRRCLGEIMESSSRVIGDLYGEQRNVLILADNSKINADISITGNFWTINQMFGHNTIYPLSFIKFGLKIRNI